MQVNESVSVLMLPLNIIGIYGNMNMYYYGITGTDYDKQR